jgi:hypothetical protein
LSVSFSPLGSIVFVTGFQRRFRYWFQRRFRYWFSVFWGGIGPCPASTFGDHGGIIPGNPAPFVGRRSIIRRAESQAIFASSAEFGVASAALFGPFEEAERDHSTEAWRNRVTPHSVCDAGIVSNDQVAVVLAAMARKLGFNAEKNLIFSSAQLTKRWRSQHFDFIQYELSVDWISAGVDFAHRERGLRWQSIDMAQDCGWPTPRKTGANSPAAKL